MFASVSMVSDEVIYQSHHIPYRSSIPLTDLVAPYEIDTVRLITIYVLHSSNTDCRVQCFGRQWLT